MSEIYIQNQKDLVALMESLKTFSLPELLKKFSENHSILAIETHQSIKDYLEALVDIKSLSFDGVKYEVLWLNPTTDIEFAECIAEDERLFYLYKERISEKGSAYAEKLSKKWQEILGLPIHFVFSPPSLLRPKSHEFRGYIKFDPDGDEPRTEDIYNVLKAHFNWVGEGSGNLFDYRPRSYVVDLSISKVGETNERD